MPPRFCPTAILVEVESAQTSVAASSLRQRRVQGHLVERRRAPLLGLQEELVQVLRLELALHSPTQVWAVVQACLESLLYSAQFAVGYQAQFRYGTRPAPGYAHLNWVQRAVDILGTPKFLGRCETTSIRLRSACAQDRWLLGDSCRLRILR